MFLEKSPLRTSGFFNHCPFFIMPPPPSQAISHTMRGNPIKKSIKNDFIPPHGSMIDYHLQQKGGKWQNHSPLIFKTAAYQYRSKIGGSLSGKLQISILHDSLQVS